MTVFHRAIADNDILRRTTYETSSCSLAAVCITSALNGDAVVACVKGTTLDEHILTRLWVAAIAIGTFVPHLHVTNGDVLREQRMHHPEWGAKHGDTLDDNIFALIQVHQLRTKTVAFAEASLIHIHTVLGILQQGGTAALALVLLNGRVLWIAFFTTHGPPRLRCGIAVNGALTCDADVLCLIGIDAGLVIPTVQSFPTRTHQRIEVGVEGKKQCGVFLNDEIHIT